MLKKIDIYIIRKYLLTFLFTILVITIIAVIIDISDKIEKFIESDCTFYEIVFDYYLNFIPFINSMLIPLYALIAVIFFTSRMAANSEFISILNAGVPYSRIMRPYLIAAFLITGFQLISNHYYLPHANKGRLDFEHSYIWTTNDKMKKRDIHMFISEDSKIYIRHYKKEQKYGVDFRLESFENGKLKKYLKANKIKWVGPPNKWQLEDYEMRSFNGLNEEIQLGKGMTKDTLLEITPDDFIRYKHQMEMLTTPELVDFIQRAEFRGLGNTSRYEVEIVKRTAEPITTLILTLIGLAVASRKVRGGLGLNLAFGLGLGAFYFFLSKLAETFSTNLDISAQVSVWIPNLLFGGLALYLLVKAQK